MTGPAATLAALALAQASAPVAAEGLDAALTGYRWQARPILVFADSAEDPRLKDQLDRFSQAEGQLAARDNVVIVDHDPSGRSALRRRFEPDGFTVILVGKDGGEKRREGRVIPVALLNETIDQMPMRRREMRESAED